MIIKTSIWLLLSVVLASVFMGIEGNKRFTTEMCKKLVKVEGNFVSSPWSANFMLAMVYQGSAGETYDAFTKVLRVKDTHAAAKESYTTLDKFYSFDHVRLTVAYNIILQKGYQFTKEFDDIITGQFNIVPQIWNLNETEEFSKHMNDWANRKTNFKVTELMKPSDLTSETTLLLLNAVQLIGFWNHQFRPEDTTKATFYPLNGKETTVDMMRLKAIFHYNENPDLNAQIVKLYYKSHEKAVSMFIILPKKRDGITELENKVSEINFANLSKQMKYSDVDISLPKFKIEFDVPMESILTEMGLGVIFTKQANLSKLSDNPVRVNKFIQKAFIEVNEQGTEDYAETSAIKGFTLTPAFFTAIFKADHPFLFAIVDDDSHNIIFFGRVSNPKY